jgi:Zn-dependent peptidase ImmA (M78 family)/DNA-binding XRE family transcriptional regulator
MDNMNLQDLQKKALGKRLLEARQARGLTQEEAAQVIGVARTTLLNIEAGKRAPTTIELAKLAHEFGRDVSDFLFIDDNLTSADIQFRSGEVEVEADTDEVNFKNLCQEYYDLERLLGKKLSFNYPAEYQMDHLRTEQAAETVAARERTRLGLGDKPIGSNFRDILENEVGLHIFYLPMERVSGMYFYADAVGGFIGINSKEKYEERRRWSLAHEYAHFLTNRYRPDVVIYSNEGIPVKGRSENFADPFARYFLMPTSSIKLRFNELLQQYGKISPALLCIMANEFGVSAQAMALRWEGEQLVTTGFYDRLVKGGFKARKVLELLNLNPPEGRADLLPTRFKQLAIEAYLTGKLDEGRLSDYLRLKLSDVRLLIESIMVD